mmetsp:Transcript_69596/g.148877  ORF Transcript_69596/g.148877 Transcript_69596/m.148877 type:complete len:605 (+) Transcript_69596:200-2014(+)
MAAVATALPPEWLQAVPAVSESLAGIAPARSDSDGDDTTVPVAPEGSATEGRRRRRQGSAAGPSGPFIVNTCACTGKSSKDLFSAVAAQLGWRERDVEPRNAAGLPKGSAKATIYCVMQTMEMLERLPSLNQRSWITRYIGLPDLCDKGNFARMVLACQDLCEPGTWDFNPRTWVLPDQLEALRTVLEKSKKTYIVKPEDGSQGDGIFLVQGLRDLDVKLSTRSNKAAVVQKYLDKPLLLGGTKFDLRLYVCLIAGSAESAPHVLLCKEGLARFCTEKYDEPSQGNMHRCMAHLTNYSLNKRSEKFEHAGESLEEVFDPASTASKRPLTAVFQQLEAEHKNFDREQFYSSVAALVQTTVAAMAPALVAFHRGAVTGGGEFRDMRCVQLLGFDVMLDRDFKPYLLEVNNSPSLCIDEALGLEAGDPRIEERGGRPGRPREKLGKVCLCMDMSQPHTHQTSMVDLHVKSVAIAGVFRLLEQLQQGVEQPEVDSYIATDTTDEDIFALLSLVEALFTRCGGAQKAFTSSTLRRTLGPICGRGTLEKHDLDSLSQRFRATHFVSHDHTRPDGLRLFDFLDLLRQVGARAFPGASPRSALDQVLAAAGR